MGQKAHKIQGDAKLFVDFTRTDDEARMVYGYATTESLDSYGTIIDLGSVEACLPDYLKWRNVREMHQPSAVGTADELTLDAKGLFVGVHVVDDMAWTKVKEGVYKGFSIGGKKDYQIGNRIFIKRINEITLGDRPSNEDCTFDTFRIFQGEEENSMKKTTEAPAGGVTGVTGVTDVKRYAGEEITDSSVAMNALESIMTVLNWEKMEAANQGEGPEGASQIAFLKAAIENLKAFISSEILEDNETVTVAASTVSAVVEMTAGENDVERVGATMSKKNLERIQAMHDHAADMGAACRVEECARIARITQDAGKVLIVGDSMAEDIIRLFSTLADAGIACEVVAEDVNRLETRNAYDSVFRVDGLDMEIPGIEGAKVVIGTMVERLKVLEAQPEPAKGVVLAVSKEQDLARIHSEEENPEPKTPLDAITRIHQGGGMRTVQL
ncbi:hypothetical protein CCP3SC15_1070004 [Gammaproteobacteria bacterium]